MSSFLQDDAPTVDDAVESATGWLLAQQAPDGWWKGELEANVTIEAEDLLLRHVLGLLTPGVANPTGMWLRSKQRADGTWSLYPGGPADLSTTVEAYVALRLVGDDPTNAQMGRAAEFIRAAGGIPATRVFTRIWLAIVGEHPWDELPAMPPEVMFIPRYLPLNIYEFACWARQTLVPLTVVASHRPAVPLPFSLSELRACAPDDRSARRGGHPLGRFVDRALKFYERTIPRSRLGQRVRRRARDRAVSWILARQEADGSWGGIQPPWVYSILALWCEGRALSDPVLDRAIRGLDRFTVHDEKGRRIEACQSPVWDTALAVRALRAGELDTEHPAIGRAVAWIEREEVTTIGDWAVRRRRLAPGGWAFEFENANYPDTDDTAEVLLALEACQVDGGSMSAVVRRAVNWLVGMQGADGGWAAFDPPPRRAWCERLPFCDFGEVVDRPSADVTAHVVEALATTSDHRAAIERGIAWLRKAQLPGGSWDGRWGANHLYGTSAVITALHAAGVPDEDPAVRVAVSWLLAHQNDDGGWGEDLRSYVDPAWIGTGTSTASQTAWVLHALLALRTPPADAIAAGVGWLVSTQTPDGTWHEDAHTGTGFPGDFYIRYGLYQHTFPLMALATAAVTGRPT